MPSRVPGGSRVSPECQDRACVGLPTRRTGSAMRRRLFSQRTRRMTVAAATFLAWLAVGVVESPAARPASFDAVPAFGHVFLIVGENASFSEITPRHAPYLTGTLRTAGAWLTHYSGLADGSLANYAAMVSGQFVRCENNNDFSFTNGDVPGQHACHQNVDNLFHQLDGRGT